MEKSFAGGVCLFRAISDCIHGRKKSSLPACVPPVLVDVNVWWNLDGCPQTRYRRRVLEFVQYATARSYIEKYGEEFKAII